MTIHAIISRPLKGPELRSAVWHGLRMEGMDATDSPDLSEQTRWMLAVRDAADRAAFGRLFDFYAPRVKAMGMRGGMSAAAAEDMAQDVMLRVWQARAQFDPTRAQASAWIYGIARNRRIDLARSAARPLPEEIPVQAGADEAGDALALAQEVEQLRVALGALPDGQRTMVERAYLGELTHQEISLQMSLPIGTVKSRIRLAVDRLRYELREMRR